MIRFTALFTFGLLVFFNSCKELAKDLDDPQQVQCLAMPVNTFALKATFTSRPAPNALNFKVAGVGEGNSCDLDGKKFPAISLNGATLTYEVMFDQRPLPTLTNVRIEEWDNCSGRNVVQILVDDPDVKVPIKEFRLCGEAGQSASLAYEIK